MAVLSPTPTRGHCCSVVLIPTKAPGRARGRAGNERSRASQTEGGLGKQNRVITRPVGPVYPGPRWAVPAAKTKGLVQNVVGESPLSCPKWGVLKAGTEQIWALELCRGSPRRFRNQRRRLCSSARDWDQAAEGAQEWPSAGKGAPCPQSSALQ